jgi:hypothetical protein
MGISDGFSSRQKADSRGPEKRHSSAVDGPAEARIFADAQMHGAERFRTRKWRCAEDLLKGLGSQFRILSR